MWCPLTRASFSQIFLSCNHVAQDFRRHGRHALLSGSSFCSSNFCFFSLPFLHTDHPDETATRTLMLVAKVVQKVANLGAFEKQDPMSRMNGLVAEATPIMKQFLESISVRARVCVCAVVSLRLWVYDRVSLLVCASLLSFLCVLTLGCRLRPRTHLRACALL